MVSNNTKDFVYCEDGHMIHKDNVKLLMQAAMDGEQRDRDAEIQRDTMLAFMGIAQAPSYLPKKTIGIYQAAYTENPKPKNSGVLPNVTETFLEFAGLRERWSRNW